SNERGAAVTFTSKGFGPTRIEDAVVARLKALSAENAAASDEQLRKQLAHVDFELEQTVERQRQISDLMRQRAGALVNLGVEKIKGLELERGKLEIDIAAKEARDKALREQIKQISQQAASRPANDPVTAQFKLA